MIKKPIVASELRLGRGRERLVGNNGELNANSKKELIAYISKLMEVASTQGVITEEEAVSREEAAALRKEITAAIFSDRQAHADFGEELASELYVTGNRQGWMRRFLARGEVNQGSFPVVRMRMKNQIATAASGPVQVQVQISRDNFFQPPEFSVVARPFVEEREILQSADDVLDEKYIEATEAIMVNEDRTLKMMFDATVGSYNNLTTIIGSLSVLGFTQIRTNVSRWGIPATSCLIATDIWNDITAQSDFSAAIDPVSKHDLLLTGQLGVIFGLSMYTDAFRYTEHQVLNQGDIYVLGASVNLGQYTDRGGISSSPIDISIERTPGRGWVLSELISMLVANGRAVAKATRSS